MATSSHVSLLFLIIIIIAFISLIVLSVIFKRFGKVIGIITLISGSFAILYAIYRSNTLEAKIARAFGSSDDLITICFIYGGFSFLLGIILVVIGFTNKKTPLVYDQYPVTTSMPTQIIKVRCPSCQKLNSETSKFCSTCGLALSNQPREY